MTAQTPAGRSHKAVLWSAIEAGGAALFSVAGAFAVARMIGPGEVGIGASAVAVHVLLWVGVNALFADAIVQRAELTETALASAVWASGAVGCVAALAQAGMGWVLAAVLGDPRLAPMGLLLALPLPLVGLAGALQGKLTRERRYRALAMRTLIGQAIGLGLGIALALHTFGAWAAVGQQAAVSLVSAIVLMAASGWRPHAIWRWGEIQDLLRVGLPLTVSTLLQIGRYRVFAVLIGGTAGAAALGHIHMAFRLVDTVRDVTFTALWRLVLPILSEHQSDRAAMLREVDRLLRLSSWAMLSICAGLALGLVPLTDLVLGAAWHEAGTAAQPLVGLMALLSLMFPSGAALAAVGQARFTLYANIAGFLATIGFVLLARPGSPDAAVLVWCGAQIFVSPYSLWVNGRALGVDPFRPLRAGLPAAITLGFAVLVSGMLTPATGLPALISREAIVLAAAAPFLWRARMAGLSA